MSASRLSPARYAPVAVLAVTLLVFAIVVAYVTLWLRSGLREQVLQREADALKEIASLQLENQASALAELHAEDAPGQLLNAVLEASKKRTSVFAVRVFDAARQFNGALPWTWSEEPPSMEDWNRLLHGQAISRLHSRESAAEAIGPAAPAPSLNGGRVEPLLETWVPLRVGESGPIAGVAQMWTVGRSAARDLDQLDHRLFTQAILAWAAGTIIIAALLGWAFRRLARANRQLEARTEDLLRANRELTLAAKTSALGAVTAHLMHELKNPVAGLEEFVAAQSELGSHGESGGELAAASELTRRLRRMINDVVAVMRDEETGAHFDLTAAEVAELAVAKVRPIAVLRGVNVETDVITSRSLPGHRANLAGLVLQNLLQNAIEASHASATVRLDATADDHRLIFSVTDHGGGLAPAVRKRLFQPCASTKQGGSGLGLALSQQLARQAGGRIELGRSDTSGTCFRVVLDFEA